MIRIAKRWVIVMLGLLPPLFAHAEPMGQFSANRDIGAVKHKGATIYDPASQQYRMRGSGKNMWGARTNCIMPTPN